MANSPLSNSDSAPSNGPSRSQPTRYCVVMRTALPSRIEPTSWLSPRTTDRHYFLAAACRWRMNQWLRQQPLPLQPAKLLSEEVSQIKYDRRNFKFFSCSPFTFLTLGAVRRDTAAYNLLIMQTIDEAIAIDVSAPRVLKKRSTRVSYYDRRMNAEIMEERFCRVLQSDCILEWKKMCSFLSLWSDVTTGLDVWGDRRRAVLILDQFPSSAT